MINPAVAPVLFEPELKVLNFPLFVQSLQNPSNLLSVNTQPLSSFCSWIKTFPLNLPFPWVYSAFPLALVYLDTNIDTPKGPWTE